MYEYIMKNTGPNSQTGFISLVSLLPPICSWLGPKQARNRLQIGIEIKWVKRDWERDIEKETKRAMYTCDCMKVEQINQIYFYDQYMLWIWAFVTSWHSICWFCICRLTQHCRSESDWAGKIVKLYRILCKFSICFVISSANSGIAWIFTTCLAN